jgi:hypothetical protein
MCHSNDRQSVLLLLYVLDLRIYDFDEFMSLDITEQIES